jgi:hypothetical protein
MMTVTVAKFRGQLFEVVKVAESVGFSEDKFWVLVTPDVGAPERKKMTFKWMPASTPFEWVRTFAF